MRLQHETNPEIINQLANFDLRSVSDYQIQEKLACMIENGMPAIRLMLPVSSVITRLRFGIGYCSDRELSYKPLELCTTYQRASIPGETVFYGVISDDDSRLDYARIVSINECSPMCRNNVQKGIEEYTCSQWVTNRKLTLLGFFSSQTFIDCSNNNLIGQCKNSYEDMLNHMSVMERKEAEAVASFISSQFFKRVCDKNNYEYKITANLTSLIHRLPDSYDGILYPSARTNGMLGLNVALFPEVADKSLCFFRKAKQVLYKNEGIVIPRIEGYTENVAVDFEDVFHFSNEELFAKLNINDLKDLL